MSGKSIWGRVRRLPNINSVFVFSPGGTGVGFGGLEKAMNHKQKLGYMVLGAVIMFIGMAVGATVSPNLIAQSNGIFDEIVCRKLTVVNKGGEEMVVLSTKGLGGKIELFSSWLKIVDTKTTGLKPAVVLESTDARGEIQLFGLSESLSKTEWKWLKKVNLGSDAMGGRLLVYDKAEGRAVLCRAEMWGGGELIVFKNTGQPAATVGQYSHGAFFKVHHKDGEQRARLGVDHEGNGYISTWDKSGYRQNIR